MTRVAVIGCGDVSAVHFDAIEKLPHAELVAVCENNPERLAHATQKYGVQGYVDYRELLELARPDVVHICTPHFAHMEPAIEALSLGINVICEKPLASSLEQGKRLVDAAGQSSAKIGICFQNRYNTPVATLYDRLTSGEFGAVLGASATVMWHRDAAYYQSRPWRGTWAGSGGGLLMNQAIHTLDLLQWMMGPVTKVAGSASNRSLRGVIEVEDTAEILLQHDNGTQSIFFASNANSINEAITVSINCELAALHLQGDLRITHHDGRVETVSEAKVDAGGRDYWGSSHSRLIEDFYSQLEQPGPFWIAPDEAFKTLSIIKEVYAQSDLGQQEQIR